MTRSLTTRSRGYLAAAIFALASAAVAVAQAAPAQTANYPQEHQRMQTTVATTPAVAEANAAAPANQAVPYVRVDTADAATVVHCAGAAWAGRSEVPASTLTANQLTLLKADSRLQVAEFERPHIETATG